MVTDEVQDGTPDAGKANTLVRNGENVPEATLDRGTSNGSRFRMVRAFIVGQISWPEVVVAILISALMYIDFAITRNGLSNVKIIGLIPWIALGLFPLGLGPYSRFLYYPIVTTLVLTEAITAFIRVNFGMLLSGEWVGIVLHVLDDM